MRQNHTKFGANSLSNLEVITRSMPTTPYLRPFLDPFFGVCEHFSALF